MVRGCFFYDRRSSKVREIPLTGQLNTGGEEIPNIDISRGLDRLMVGGSTAPAAGRPEAAC
jgi:hypothetical protein